ncbi:MAG: hypothetical protein ACPF9D_08680 [Owenweeksia sp.]
MKKFIFLFALATLVSIPDLGFAQISSQRCYSNVRGKACVGDCSPFRLDDGFEYTVSCTGPIVPLYQGFCVNVVNFNLCPSHKAVVYIYVNGTYVTGGSIGAAGQTFHFQASCGDVITVKMAAIDQNNGINCVQFGNASIHLTSQY